MKFRSCFNIFEKDEPLEPCLPTEDIEFWEEEVDFDFDENECCSKEQLKNQISQQLNTDINDIEIK